MKKVLIGTAGLLACVLALGIYMWRFESRPAPAAPGEWQPTPVLPHPEAPLDRLTLIRSDDKIVFEQDPQAKIWMIKEPLSTFVDPMFVEPLFRDVPKTRKEKLISLEPADLSLYQLDRPAVQIVFHYRDGTPEATLLIGKLNYNQDRYFAKLKDQKPVFLISTKIESFLIAPFDAFRSKSLFHRNPEQVMSFQTKIDDPEFKKALGNPMEVKLVVQKGERGQPQWQIVDPIQETAVFAVVGAFFKRLLLSSSQTVIDVKDGNFAPYGLDQPRARILLTLVDGSREEVDFGAVSAADGTIYARNQLNTEVLPMDLSLFQDLFTSCFRNTQILNINRPLKVTRLDVEFPGDPRGNFSLLQDLAFTYRFADQPEQQTVRARVQWIIGPFRNYLVTYAVNHEPYPRKDYGLDPPRMRVKIYEGDALSMDMSVGNTVVRAGEVHTFLEDNLRKCILETSVDLVNEIPTNRGQLVATPEEIELAKKRSMKAKNEEK